LGKRLGISKVSGWGKSHETDLYAAPKLYLGDTPLLTGKYIRSFDFKQMHVGRNIVGILGIDCLKHYCIQLDFEAGKMHFLDPDRLEVEKLGHAFPITFPREGRPFIHHGGLAGGTSTNMLMDATLPGKGSGRGLPVTYALIDSGFDSDGRVDTNAVAGHVSGWVHLPECVWEGETYTNLQVGIGQDANLLGLRFLARHLVTLNFPHQVMYLKQTSVGPI
jgi:hypothetical protein